LTTARRVNTGLYRLVRLGNAVITGLKICCAERWLTRVLVIEFCCKVAVIFLALYAVKFSMFCSNDCFSADYAVYSLEGVVCGG